MLVLTRRANQSIMIGHDIVVTVLEVRGDQVRLGIRAPRSVDVHREEVFASLQQSNKAAAASARDHVLDEALPNTPTADPVSSPRSGRCLGGDQSTTRAASVLVPPGVRSDGEQMSGAPSAVIH